MGSSNLWTDRVGEPRSMPCPGTESQPMVPNHEASSHVCLPGFQNIRNHLFLDSIFEGMLHPS